MSTRYDHPHPWVSADTYVWDVNLLMRVKAQQALVHTDSLSVALTGVASAAKQDTGNTTLASLLTELQLKADLTETQPVSAASLPLPAGAATAARQDTGNSTLSSLLTELQLKADLTETQPVNQVNPAFDSGLVVMPDSLTVVTASTIRALGLLLTNLTASAVAVTVTNTAGTAYLDQYPLQGRMTVVIPLERVTMAGIKWQAGAAASVNAQIWG